MSFRRALGPFDATMIVIGGIIGSGIFINPYLVARQLDSTSLVLLAMTTQEAHDKPMLEYVGQGGKRR